jgi:hypothetical protein
MRNENTFTHLIKTFLIAAVLATGVQVSAQTWTAPVSSPPANNTPAPLNVGASGQTKDGGLVLGHTLSNSPTGCSGGPCIGLRIENGKLKITDGSQAAGKVLTSDATGLATWSDAPGGTLPAGNTNGETLRYSGTAWVKNTNIFNNGTAVGIGTADPRATLHVRNPNGDSLSTVLRISKLGNGAGHSTLQLYKGTGATWSGWAFLNNQNGDFRLNYDSTENNSPGEPAIFVKNTTRAVGIGMRQQGAGPELFIDSTGKSALSVGGKIYVDLTDPYYGSDTAARRDVLQFIGGGSSTVNRVTSNKPLEFWNSASSERADLYAGTVNAEDILSAQYIKLKPDNVASVPAHKFLTAVQTDGSADWKFVGAQGAEEFRAISGGRADCVPGSGKVVTGISVDAGGQVTGVWCKSLQAF